jgi:Domain of unknown function (DUF1835)
MKTLIITNGDEAAARMKDARINGEILCWRDILHEGPVPVTETLEELSSIRVNYLAHGGWGVPEEIFAAFAERDAIMRNLASFADITLWFEHDLYDQLQLLQILDFLARESALHSRISLIQAGSFIGQETPSRLRMHLKLKQQVSDMQYALGQAAWGAFRSPSPESWAALLRYDTSALPFLRPSILRHLEEYPAPYTGLTRTEAFILGMIYTGIATPMALFHLFGENEEAAFMGDWSFWRILDSLAQGAAPFVTGLRFPFSPGFDDELREVYLNSELKLTGLGVTAMSGKKDAIEFRRLDRWMGGVHLTNRTCWRWDAGHRMLVGPPNGRA